MYVLHENRAPIQTKGVSNSQGKRRDSPECTAVHSRRRSLSSSGVSFRSHHAKQRLRSIAYRSPTSFPVSDVLCQAIRAIAAKHGVALLKNAIHSGEVALVNVVAKSLGEQVSLRLGRTLLPTWGLGVNHFAPGSHRYMCLCGRGKRLISRSLYGFIDSVIPNRDNTPRTIDSRSQTSITVRKKDAGKSQSSLFFLS